MPNYSVLYSEMFQAVTKAIEILQEAQIKTEEIYIESELAALLVLHGSNHQNENKSDGDDKKGIPDKESLRKTIGNNIQTLRLKDSMTLEELSEKLGITPGFLGLLERGHRAVTPVNLVCLSDVFNISIDDLVRPLNLEPEEIRGISAK